MINWNNIRISFRRSRLFTAVNIVGLSLGIAVSVMLILFVLNELSFDRHFKDADRIISLHTVLVNKGNEERTPRSIRQAMTDVPEKVAGIEAVTQIFNSGYTRVLHQEKEFYDIRLFYTESGFFDVFQMKVLAGSVQPLDEPNTMVITDTYAQLIFGDIEGAVNQILMMNDEAYTVCGVVESLPKNTHFSFGILTNIYAINYLTLDHFTFYKIAPNVSLDGVSKQIADEYTRILRELAGGHAYGATEKLTDIYLHTKATNTLGKRSDMSFVWLLTVISLLILILGVTNFVNLFTVQGENRTLEIGIRKTTGAENTDLVRLFFWETAVTVLISFILGLLLAIFLLPFFATLIGRSLDLAMLLEPEIITCLVLLYVVVVFASAFYPSFYLSRFAVLDIMGKKLVFSKRRLMSIIVIFQSVAAILLLGYLMTIHYQTTYLGQLPIHYNPKQVMMTYLDKDALSGSTAIIQELKAIPGVKEAALADHYFGRTGGGSTQSIRLIEDKDDLGVNEYRVESGICEMMELELVEGRFFRQNDAKTREAILLNEAAVKLLGLNYPVVGKTVLYRGQPMEILGVVKDFVYDLPQNKIEPLAIGAYRDLHSMLYIKFEDNVSRQQAYELTENTIRKVDSGFALHPVWAADLYNDKLQVYHTQAEILLYASLIAMLIATLGLLAIQSYAVVRRTKEVAIRRVNGATGKELFLLLSTDIFKWVCIAGLLAVPLLYYVATDWLANYANRVSLNLWIFIIPIVAQLFVALLATSGVILKVISKNPVESLKSE